MSDAALVRRDDRDGVAVVTLVDEARRNALSGAMVDQIVATFDALEADDGITAAVVTGAPPAFCSGADVGNLAHLSSDAGASQRGSVRGVYAGFLRVLDSSLPTIAAINGPAIGAGANLALACDVRLIGESGWFDPKFPRIGLHPGGGHTWLLERAVGPQTAAAVLLFGQGLDAPRAVASGLAWSRHDDDALVDAAVTLASRSAKVPKPLIAKVKQTLREMPFQASFADAVDVEIERQTWSFGQGWFGRS